MSTSNQFSVVTVILLFLFGCGGGGSDGDDPVDRDLCGTVVDIEPNSLVNGVLETGDCRLTDVDPTTRGLDSFIDEYRITLNATDTLEIKMRSADVDAFLLLLNRSTSCSDGCTAAEAMPISFDDDSGGGANGLDAFISMDLAPGTYGIWATSISVPAGSYTLETTFGNPGGGGGGPTNCQIGIVADGTCVQLGFTATDQVLNNLQTRAYEWKGITPGKTYRVSINSTNTIGNTPVYDNSNFNPPTLCLMLGSPGSCDAVATGTSLYILVSDTGGGGTFNLNVKPVTP